MDIPYCASCSRPASLSCKRCGLKSYCSQECMDNHTRDGHHRNCSAYMGEHQVQMLEPALTQGTWVHILSFLELRSLFVCQQTSKGLLCAVRKILCRRIPDFFPQKTSFSMNVATAHQFRSLLSHEKSILITGGAVSFSDNNKNISLLKVVDNQFQVLKIGELKEASTAHAAVMDNDGGICLLGGVRNQKVTNSVQRIVPNYFDQLYEGTFTEYCQPMKESRCNLSAARGIDGVLFAIGGSKAFFKTKSVLDSVEICRGLDSEPWAPGPTLNSPRTGHSSATTSAGLIFTVGGFNGSTFLKSVEYLDPSDQWIELPSMEVSRSGAGVGYTANGYIYVVGGLNDSENGLASFERYDFREGRWQTLAPMANRRCFCTTAVTENYLYVIGGYETFGKTISQVEVFDFRTELWQTTQAQYNFYGATATSLI